MTRWDPLRDVASLQDEMERVFRGVLGEEGGRAATAGAWAPALDVEETEDHFTLHVELPGVSADDVEVSLEENVLTISGQRRFYDQKEADGFKRIERHFGRFHRAIRLPDRVAVDEVEANFTDGMLVITVPKAEEAKPRRIEVTTS
ncbi:MAG: Hsp20/alpha crystallin family protein [Nitriliruptorales bacterium]|nr:Hsp20/alpha crystallin family protein [Nitriliruptorales bacterium]